MQLGQELIRLLYSQYLPAYPPPPTRAMTRSPFFSPALASACGDTSATTPETEGGGGGGRGERSITDQLIVCVEHYARARTKRGNEVTNNYKD